MTVRVLTGAKSSKIPCKTESYSLTTDLESRISSRSPERCITSSINFSKSKFFSFIVLLVFFMFEGFIRFKLKQITLWSEIDCSRTEML